VARSRYLLALGSNRPHGRYGRPQGVLDAAVIALVEQGIEMVRVSPILSTPPVGPSQRRYANGAAIIETTLRPLELLARLKTIERSFGRRSGGQRWAARVLDLDIVLWDDGAFAAPGLTIPHPLFRERLFVLQPAAAIAPDWRDPITGYTLRQLTARLTARRHLPR